MGERHCLGEMSPSYGTVSGSCSLRQTAYVVLACIFWYFTFSCFQHLISNVHQHTTVKGNMPSITRQRFWALNWIIKGNLMVSGTQCILREKDIFSDIYFVYPVISDRRLHFHHVMVLVFLFATSTATSDYFSNQLVWRFISQLFWWWIG